MAVQPIFDPATCNIEDSDDPRHFSQAKRKLTSLYFYEKGARVAMVFFVSAFCIKNSTSTQHITFIYGTNTIKKNRKPSKVNIETTTTVVTFGTERSSDQQSPKRDPKFASLEGGP